MIKLGKGTLNAIYPVGSIYMSTNSINPSQLFGGTWEQIAKGRTLVGVDTGDTDFNTAKKTGGEKKHTLTVAEMPRHQHNIGNGNDGGVSVDWTNYFVQQSIQKGWWSNIYTNWAGGNQAHNNLQPYFCVYIWCRTA